MGVPRMIQGQFGAVRYDTGQLLAGVTTPVAPTVEFNETTGSYQGVKRHNDQFYIQQAGSPLDVSAIHFMTYDYVDLRDLLEAKACMDDVVINVQRQYELPYPDLSYNVPAGNIEETFLILLGDYDLEKPGDLAGLSPFNVKNASKAGFVPLKDLTGNDSQGGLPFEVLYREVRQYVQDPSQNFTSPNQIGTFAGPGGNPGTPSRLVGNFRMASRTIGGYPDLLVGPGITVVRAWSIYPSNRLSQEITGGATAPVADAPAAELIDLAMRLQVHIPALQYNIVGTQRPLTATETATYYSNILMKS